MSENNKSFRIKYDTQNPADHVKVQINQDFDLLEVLSLKINQEDAYKLYASNYGVVIGRVQANDGFGIPNAKVSIFIQNDNLDKSKETGILYPYTTTSDKNANNVRYNLLPAKKVNKCHQNVGTFPSKRNLLDNDVNIDVFDNFFEYTTVTNESGDYMLFGVPVGEQQIHVDIDLSDIGVLSQSPRDMVYKGYDLNKFDSPNKFKGGTNLDDLTQIISQDTGIYVYPFWGDESETEIAITQKTIDIQYKFEPTCVFMGSAFTDSKKSGISKTCKASKNAGLMSDMVTSQGTIEMIRKTIEGKIEQYDINGTRLINNEGVWCYQIPMNLDYVITDEYGNIIPTTDPSKGIPTRSEVRFKITLDDNGDAYTQDKTGTYLIPNNPQNGNEVDYNFDDNCIDKSFVNLLWNKVYSVKNYIPRIQKNIKPKNRNFSGIKSTNYHESKNPIPYNNIYVDLNLRFILTCLLTTFFIKAVGLINSTIHWVNANVLNLVPGAYLKYIGVDSGIVGEDCLESLNLNNFNTLYFIDLDFAPRNWSKSCNSSDCKWIYMYGGESETYYNSIISCIETTLSFENQVVNFDFTNDWLNGGLYLPRFFTKTKRNKKTGSISIAYCGSWFAHTYKNYIVQACAPNVTPLGESIDNSMCDEPEKSCYKKSGYIRIGSVGDGLLNRDDSKDVFYYKSNEFLEGFRQLYTTDVILLGSLNDCDIDGIPQLHQLLPSTSFKLPNDSFEADDSLSGVTESYAISGKTMSGIDWGNDSTHMENGLFVAIGCLSSDTTIKTCVNASRLCEIGVDFDEKYTGSTDNGYDIEKNIDGMISTDEISDGDARSMFATLNINKLVGGTEYSDYDSNLWKYNFKYNYPDGFDGRLRGEHYNKIGGSTSGQLTSFDVRNDYYYKFRLGIDNINASDVLKKTYGGDYSFPRFDNSFYFYFGLIPGKTALDLFNSQYFVPCTEPIKDKFNVFVTKLQNESICPSNDGKISIKVENAVYPYNVYLDGQNIIPNVSDDNAIIRTGLISKFYSVKVVDGNNDSVTKYIFVPKNVGVSYDLTITPVKENGKYTGIIEVTNIKNDNINNYSNLLLSLYNGKNNFVTSITINSFMLSTQPDLVNKQVFGLLVSDNYKVVLSQINCQSNILEQQALVKSPPSLLSYVSGSNSGATSESLTTAISGGNIYADNGSEIIERGVCWTLTGTTPTILNNNIYDNISKTGEYLFTLTGLTTGLTYNIRSYATNNIGLSYGDVKIYKHTYNRIDNKITIVTWDVSYNTIDEYGNVIGTTITYYSNLYAINPVKTTLTVNTNIGDVTILEGQAYSDTFVNSDISTINSITPTNDDYYNYIHI